MDHQKGFMKKTGQQCKHPNHKEYIEAFLRKYPTAKRAARYAIIKVDSEHWYISDDQKKNTVKCCQLCSISEDISRACSRNIPAAD
jgi:hypothetical protein